MHAIPVGFYALLATIAAPTTSPTEIPASVRRLAAAQDWIREDIKLDGRKWLDEAEASKKSAARQLDDARRAGKKPAELARLLQALKHHEYACDRLREAYTAAMGGRFVVPQFISSDRPGRVYGWRIEEVLGPREALVSVYHVSLRCVGNSQKYVSDGWGLPISRYLSGHYESQSRCLTGLPTAGWKAGDFIQAARANDADLFYVTDERREVTRGRTSREEVTSSYSILRPLPLKAMLEALTPSTAPSREE